MIPVLTGSKSRLLFRQHPADDRAKRRPEVELAKRIFDWSLRTALDAGRIQAVAYFSDSGSVAPGPCQRSSRVCHNRST